MAIRTGKAFTISKLEDDAFSKDAEKLYEAKIGKHSAPFLFNEEDLDPHETPHTI